MATQERICPSCEKRINAGDVRCDSCGYDVNRNYLIVQNGPLYDIAFDDEIVIKEVEELRKAKKLVVILNRIKNEPSGGTRIQIRGQL